MVRSADSPPGFSFAFSLRCDRPTHLTLRPITTPGTALQGNILATGVAGYVKANARQLSDVADKLDNTKEELRSLLKELSAER